jgi:hypothetical protein
LIHVGQNVSFSFFFPHNWINISVFLSFMSALINSGFFVCEWGGMSLSGVGRW